MLAIPDAFEFLFSRLLSRPPAYTLIVYNTTPHTINNNTKHTHTKKYTHTHNRNNNNNTIGIVRERGSIDLKPIRVYSRRDNRSETLTSSDDDKRNKERARMGADGVGGCYFVDKHRSGDDGRHCDEIVDYCRRVSLKQQR